LQEGWGTVAAETRPEPAKKSPKRKTSLDHTDRAPELVDSCNFGGFDPYVRMGSVLGSEKRTKEAPPVSDSQCFAKPTKPPPIPPRTSKYHK